MKDLSIILPVYNERQTIESVLKSWKKELSSFTFSYTFIICEDGSTDGTKELLKKLKTTFPLVLNKKKQRRGYGRAVLDGISSAKSEYILCIDSDGQCDPKDFKKFWQKKGKAQVLIGWRKKRADAMQRKIFSTLFHGVFYFLFPSSIHDPSAPFVLFKKKDIAPLQKYLVFLTEGFWWGFVGMCIKKKITMQEIPINHRDRLMGDTQVYKLKKIPSIAIRNLFGLFQLKLAR